MLAAETARSECDPRWRGGDGRFKMADAKKIRVGVLFGGRSSEHEISLRSALTVMSAMDPARYEVVPIGIGRDGRWYLRGDAIRDADRGGPEAWTHSAAAVSPVSLLPHPHGRALVRRRRMSRAGAGKERAIAKLPGPLDVVFPVLHGTYGEDGTVQGLLELAGIPYVGAGVLGSAVGMDKDVQKRLLRDAGIAGRALSRRSSARQWRENARARGRPRAIELGYPVFVKPNALGSSIGISKVKQREALGAALEDAFQYDRKVLIEAVVRGARVRMRGARQ